MLHPRVGQVVAKRYEIRGLLGERPLGTMFRALDREIGVEVALRVLGTNLLPDAAARRAFVQRVGKAKGLSHPNLVRLHGVFVDEDIDQAVVAVQWAPGAPLAERVRLGVPRVEARALLRRIASAVAHAHQHGVYLGEVRTDTVVVLEDTLKLFTVGIGASIPRDQYLAAVRDTPIFSRLAPEVRAGKAVEPAADVYSLGVLAAELLTGSAPGTPLSVPGVLPETVALIGSALSTDPRERPTNVDAFASQLDQLLAGVTPERKPRKTRDRVPAFGPGDADVTDAKVHDETTRQVKEDELRALQGSDVTRRASEDEIFPLRVQSTETSQTDLAELDEGEETDSGEELRFGVPKAIVDDGTTRSGKRPVGEEAQLTERVVLLEPEHAHTSRVPRVLDHGDEAEDEHTTEVPRADPPTAPAHDNSDGDDRDDNDDDSLTERVEKLSPEDLIAVKPRQDRAPSAPSVEIQGLPLLEPSAPVRITPERPSATAAQTRAPEPPRVAVPPPRPAAEPVKPELRTGPEQSEQPGVSPSRGGSQPAGVPEPPRPAIAPPRPPVEPPSIPSPTVAPPPLFTAPEPSLRGDPQPLPPRPGPAPIPPPGADLPQLLVVPAAKSPFAAPRSRIPLYLGLAAVVVVAAVATVYLLTLSKPRSGSLPTPTALPTPPSPSAPPTPTAPTGAHPIVTHPDLPTPVPTPDPAPPAVAASSSCGAGMVPVNPHLCIDAYEAPGHGAPRQDISFADAAQACESRGARLCTDLEWEHACRGHGGASYPYGNSYDAKRCNTATSDPKPVGSFPACRSATGALDMSGNVAEWVTAKGTPAHKGGSAFDGNPTVRCSTTQKNVTAGPSPHVGFRCCQSTH